MANKKDLELQLAQAREQLEQMKVLNQPENSDQIGNMLMNELQALKKKSTVSTGSIPVKYVDDHKNIPLYTMLNKVIGPMHPDNARSTMERFYAAGYPLFLTPRTPEQIEAYKQTDTYKKREAVRQKDRLRKVNKKPSAQLEKFAKIIAQETGKSFKEISEVVAVGKEG
jgi:hypothetical protein